MPVVITKRFQPKSRADWRSWLAKHQGEPEIWLVRYKKSSGRQSLSYADTVEEALCFGWIDNVEKSIDGQRFATRFSPRKPRSHWTDTNVKLYRRLLRQGQMQSAGQVAFRTRHKT